MIIIQVKNMWRILIHEIRKKILFKFFNILEVGQGFGKYNLAEALFRAKKNTTILIEPGHYVTPKDFCVFNNLTIRGKTDDPKKVIINCKFLVLAGLKFNLENVCVEIEEDDMILNLEQKSFVEIKNCIIRNLKIYPNNKVGKVKVYAYKAILNISDSKILSADNTKLVTTYNESIGTIKNSEIQGIITRNGSKVSIKDSKFISTLMSINNSKVSVDNLRLDLIAENKYSFYLENDSQILVKKVELEKEINIKGFVKNSYLKINKFIPYKNTKLDVIHNMQSTVEGDLENINLILQDENIRIENDKREEKNNKKEEIKKDEVVMKKKEKKEKEEESFFGISLEDDEIDEGNKEKKLESENVEKGIDYLKELENLYGIEKVKRKVKEFIAVTSVNKQREKSGIKGTEISFHSVFLGNPGTGKTTVARILGKLLYQYGVIKKDVFIEVSRENLVGEYVGQTAIKTKEVLEKALGGILFIDEAYTLHKDGNDFGKESVDTILKFMEDNKNNIMIIFAGYTNEMMNFLNMNPGLKSRIPNEFEFEDYSEIDIANIGYDSLKKAGYIVDEQFYKKNLSSKYKREVDKSNARYARNFNDQILLKQALRISSKENMEKYINIIENEDISSFVGGNEDSKEDKINELIEKINSLIGLENVKEYVTDLLKQAKVDKKLKEMNVNNETAASYHMIFTGNPGTGKTTIARIIAEIFYNLDILTSNNVVEVSRPDLVAGYVGQTEAKTKKVITSAMGGVLFIDEAYQLSNGNDNDFGKEAIETLIISLENYRTNFIAIFAGYTKDMEEFLDVNPGLRSRIPITIEFPDYTPEEIGKIVRLNLTKKWNIGTYPIEEEIAKVYSKLDVKEKSNARWARNISEEIIKEHKIWIADNETDNKDITVINKEVLDAVISSKILN